MPEDKLLELLRIELGIQDSLTSPLDEKEWDLVFTLARKHSVVGLVYGAIERLDKDWMPPRKYKIQFAILAEKIRQKNELQSRQCSQLTEELASLSLKSCILKGQGIATLYPHPNLRQCGDIDVWVSPAEEGGMPDRRETVKLLETRWPTGKTFYHHVDIRPFGQQDTEVEVHFTPSWMNNFFNDNKLQGFFRAGVDEQCSNFYLDEGFSYPTCAFNTVYGMIHLYRHLFSEGFGLRQLCDYYEILTHSSSEDRIAAAKLFKSLGMSRFVCSIMYVMREIFSLDSAYFIMHPDEKYGKVIKKEIFLAGNFGKYDKRNEGLSSGYNPATFMRKTIRVFRYLPISPGEALWSPVFRLWQYFWRRKNSDIFK